MTDLVATVARRDQPTEVFKALERLVDETIGVKLFTLMEIDPDRGVARRNYTNMPDAYPSGGEKEIEENVWTQIVQDRHETFVANSIEEIAKVFSDYELIKSLGCESCLNLPIVVGGEVIGTINCLHEAGHYTPERVSAAENLKEHGAMAFLVDAYLTRSN